MSDDQPDPSALTDVPLVAEKPAASLRRVFTEKEPKHEIALLLEAAGERQSLELDEADAEAVPSLIAMNDLTLQRSRRLIFEAAIQTGGRWSLRAGQLVLPALPGGLLEDREIGATTSTTRLDAAAAAEMLDTVALRFTRQRYGSPASGAAALKARRRTFSVLMLFTTQLHRQSELDIDDVVAILSSRLGRADKGTQEVTVRQGIALEQLTNPLLTEERTRERLDLVRRWSQQAQELRRVNREQDSRLRVAAARAERLQDELRASESTIARLQDELAAKEEELISSSARESGAEVAGRLDLQNVAGRMDAFLSGPLDRQLASALQALNLEPPRTAIAAEKLEIALDDIQERLTWLRSLA